MTDNTDHLRFGRRAPAFAPLPEWVLVAGLTPQAVALYALLLAHVNRSAGNGLAWPGMTALAALLGYSRRQSVAPYLTELEAVDAIAVLRERPCATGWRNEYVVHELPPEAHPGPRDLSDFYARRRAEQKKTRGGSCAPAHQGSSAGAHQGSCAPAHTNQRKATRGTEPDVHPSGEDAACATAAERRTPAPARTPATPTLRAPHDLAAKPIKAFRSWLIRATTAAMQAAGHPLTTTARDNLGAQTYTAGHTKAARDRMADLVQAALADPAQLAAALDRGDTVIPPAPAKTPPASAFEPTPAPVLALPRFDPWSPTFPADVVAATETHLGRPVTPPERDYLIEATYHQQVRPVITAFLHDIATGDDPTMRPIHVDRSA